MPKAIYFDIGNRAGIRERAVVEKIQDRFPQNIIIDKSLKLGQWELPNGYLPYRNLYFLMAAAQYAENVILAQISEYAPDKCQHFYRRTEKLLREIGHGKFQGIDKTVKIWTPFASYTKTRLVREYLRHFPAEDLKLTTSCYASGLVNCGVCSGCVTRYIAMKNNGILEPYAVEPDVSSLSKRWDLRDFHIAQIPMYLRRWLELRELRRNEKGAARS